ncbi:OmpA family protein [Bowmanella denitrificans]|uniref:OmpA family protein n=1 Tax=Bowmanella denitrificans TaxID=366582 RepID=UPI000C9C596D|nr:OmpA family protein [Bowmanella denitrificans]
MKLNAVIKAALFSLLPVSSVLAQETPEYGAWVAGFGEYYKVDNDKPNSLDSFDDASGLGAELGFRFTPEWGARLEWSRLNFDSESGLNDRDGDRFGIDALHYFDKKQTYLFAGFKHQNLGENYRLVNFGLGRHWDLSQNWKLVTEAAAYYDFGQDFTDFGLKLGLAYTFGGNSASGGTPSNISSQLNEPAQTATDSDGDGVNDNQDRCANTPKGDRVDAFGCTLFDEKTVSSALDMLFAHDSHKIANPDSQQVKNFADFMQQYPDTTVTIEGHTSLVGTEAYNQQLSERRAAAVKKLLVERYAISAERISTVGYGESRPLDRADNEAAHSANRRIHAQVSTTKKVKLTR